ncbi:MAG: metallophosphoesterase, partial [Erysipelotrichaceae bacterium]|nr:metallophosphoesterase [Erysipelotrichaceae bacterium]
MNNSEEVRLMVATDLHHLSKTLYDEESEIFARLMASNDGKLSEESGAIVQALKEKAIEEKPDALLLAGDLTFNGELVSLNELADVFAEIEEAGIPVLVISGNHDINYSGAASYFGSEAQPVSRISPEEFAAVMGSYGFEEALYRDPSSLSYVSEIKEDLWLLVLDANVPSEPGS